MRITTEDTYYKDIADAIRKKTGSSETEYYPKDMAQAILGLTMDAKCSLVVQTELGSIVSAIKAGEEAQYPVERNGIYVFGEMVSGEWTITAQSADGTKEVTRLVKIAAGEPGRVIKLFYGPKINDFSVKNLGTLTTDYSVQYDNGDPIPEEEWDEAVNWRILIYKSSSLTVNKTCNIDIFAVGGGAGGGGGHYSKGATGGGGGGGYTTTVKNTIMHPNQSYQIQIGAGGSGTDGEGTGGRGGTTTVTGLITAEGGYGGTGGIAGSNGGNGGSGGGGGNNQGGYGGGNGYGSSAGTGQGTPTTEFGESNEFYYAGGGGGGTQQGGLGGGGRGGSNVTGGAGAANTGGGGGGSVFNNSNAGKGGSGGCGIVVIRNTRTEEEIEND